MQKKKVCAIEEKAARENREPSLSEIREAALLTNAESMAAAVAPWERAFRDEKNVNGWKEEGIVPFTRKLAWDMLKEEEHRGIKVPPVPDSSALLSAMGLNPLSGPGSLNAPDLVLEGEDLDSRFEMLVLAEMATLGFGFCQELSGRPARVHDTHLFRRFLQAARVCEWFCCARHHRKARGVQRGCQAAHGGGEGNARGSHSG